jgi:DNA-binding NarL/FixJ family response regulator
MEKIMTSNIYVSVIAKPGRFRESIQVLLTSISQISEVFPTENLKEMLSLAAIITPAIVVLDSRVANHDLPTALRLIGDTWQGVNRIVLVEDKNELHQAKAHGAELVLWKGFTASMFINEIEKILEDC